MVLHIISLWHQLGLWKESTDYRLWWNLVSLILWIFKKNFGHFYLQTESLSPRRSSISHLKNPGGGFSDRTGSSGTHLRHSSVQSSQVCSSGIQIYTACKYVNILHMIYSDVQSSKVKITNILTLIYLTVTYLKYTHVKNSKLPISSILM